MRRYRILTEFEKHVLLETGTEAPYSGKYTDLEEAGMYLCRQCDLPLFSSKDKFPSQCGWPSFDAAISGAVSSFPDPDGRRTEIRCSRCLGHLGHVFTGERFTENNTRYCVNSTSLYFNRGFLGEHKERAIYAAGCFWGVQYLFHKIPGTLETTAGYTGGTVVDPTYEEVCSEKTGHLEAVEVIFDPRYLSYEELTKDFFSLHDPTQRLGQGADIGPQYLSCIFFLTEKQRKIAENLLSFLKKKGRKIATTLKEASLFYPAERYHQHYYEKMGKTPHHRFSKKFW